MGKGWREGGEGLRSSRGQGLGVEPVAVMGPSVAAAQPCEVPWSRGSASGTAGRLGYFRQSISSL